MRTQLDCFTFLIIPTPVERPRKGSIRVRVSRNTTRFLPPLPMDYSDKRSIPEDGSPEAADPIFPYGSDGLCCCFAPMYLRRNSISTSAEWWGRIPAGGGVVGAGVTSGWWNRGAGALMKIREWSELVAGPRWKTFIRRFNRNTRCSRIAQRFQYDPFSYALNFDDGFAGSESPENDSRLGELSSSSSRYAITPPAKPRMEIQASPASPDFTVDRPRAPIGPG